MELIILLTLGFSKVCEKASDWLKENQWNVLFLDLPSELEPFLMAYVKGRIDEKTFWNNLSTLTGLADPFINSLKFRYQTILRSVKRKYRDDEKIVCYRDLDSYIKLHEVIEKILILEFKNRIGSDLKLEKWRDVLIEEEKISKSSWNHASENILEEAEENSTNVISYEGSLQSLKRLKRGPIKVKVMLLKDYWKSPLGMLRTVMWKYGIDNIPDKEMIHYLRLQQKYLELIIRSKDLEKAYESWETIVQKLPRELSMLYS